MREVERIPELARGQRFCAVPVTTELEHVSQPQAFDRDVLFPQIAVKRGCARDLRRHVLDAVCRSGHHGAIRPAHSNVVNVNTLSRVLIGKGKHAISLQSGVGLDSDPGSGLASACAIILEDNLRRILLNDEWFFGIVGFGGSWLGGRLSANAAQIKARTQTQHEEAQILRHQVGCT